MKLITILLLFISMLAATQARSAENMRIAILDFKAQGISSKAAKVIANMVRTDMVKMGKFTVVERTQMNEIMKEQGLQMAGCTDENCAIRVGRLISANKILVGEVGKLGTSIIITVRIVDVERGVTEFSEKEKALSNSKLPEAVEKLTAKLSDSIEKAHAIKVPAGYYLRSIVPGWGQFYAGSTAKGWVYAGIFSAACAFSAWAHYDYFIKQRDYKNLAEGLPQSTYDKKHSAAKKAGNLALYSFGIIGAVYIVHWVDVLFFTKNRFKTINTVNGTVALQKEGFFFDIVFKADAVNYSSVDKTTCVTFGYRF